MLISMHLLKAGGQTFEDVLTSAFGEGKVLLDDYGVMSVTSNKYRFTNPLPQSLKDTAKRVLRTNELGRRLYRGYSDLASRTVEDMPAGIECIHGHFPISKYLTQYPDAATAVWVRDPAERLASLYGYLQRISDASPKWFRETRPSFRDFALSEHFRNEMAANFDTLPMESFNFVGITERYTESLGRFNLFLRESFDLEAKQVKPRNVNPEKTMGAGYAIDPGLRSEIYAYHSLDTALYTNAVNRFEGNEPLRELSHSLHSDRLRV